MEEYLPQQSTLFLGFKNEILEKIRQHEEDEEERSRPTVIRWTALLCDSPSVAIIIIKTQTNKYNAKTHMQNKLCF